MQKCTEVKMQEENKGIKRKKMTKCEKVCGGGRITKGVTKLEEKMKERCVCKKKKKRLKK